MKRMLRFAACCAAFMAASLHAWPQSSSPDPAGPLAIPADVPLRVAIEQTVALKPGQPIRGRLIEPVYGPNRLLLPAGTEAKGIIASTPAADRSTRVNAKLDGDFTPLRVPIIRLTDLVLSSSGVHLPVDAAGGMRNTATIRLAAHPPPTSLAGRIKAAFHAQVQQLREAAHDPHKADRLKQLLYSQLPYHPQRIWAGSEFDAVLRRPSRCPRPTLPAPCRRPAMWT